MRYLITLILGLLSLCSLAQNSRIRKAEQAYAHKEYKVVIKHLNKVRFSDLTEYQKLLRAESYKETHQYEKALHAFENLNFEILNSDSAYLHFAQVLETNGNYDKALKYYNLYHKKYPDHVTSESHVETCSNLGFLNFSGKQAIITRFSHNTSENDLVGFIYDHQLVFSSGGYSKSLRRHKWDGQHFQDYYLDGKLVVSPFSNVLNSKLHEGPGYYDTIRNKLFFTRNSVIHDVSKKSTISNLKIYESSFNEGKWTKPLELPFNDELYSRGHPASLSGKDFLIFSSNQTGGEADLYQVYKENGAWKEPVRLQGNINTEGQELFPYLLNDSTLYFASDGHGGYGGLDIFVCKIKNGKTSEIRNLGSAFNSRKDDFGLVFNNSNYRTGYFCSDKDGGIGSSDIYLFEIEEPNKVLRFVDPWDKPINSTFGELAWGKRNKVITTGTNGETKLDLKEKEYVNCLLTNYYPKIEEVDFTMQDTVEVVLYPKDYFVHVSGHLNSEENNPVDRANIKVNIDDVVYESATDENGDFDMLLPEKKQYVFEFKKEGFLANEIVITKDKEADSPQIQKVEKGTILNLENIYYDFDRDHITQKAKPILETLIKIMNLNPKLEIEVSSHADSRGSSTYNKDLSLRRAKSVVDYLEEKGVDIDRLSIKYYGEKKLTNDCGDDKDCLENTHSQNRRTEFKVIQF